MDIALRTSLIAAGFDVDIDEDGVVTVDVFGFDIPYLGDFLVKAGFVKNSRIEEGEKATTEYHTYRKGPHQFVHKAFYTYGGAENDFSTDYVTYTEIPDRNQLEFLN